jgi:adenosylcobinamide-GDP ribazoletransferase
MATGVLALLIALSATLVLGWVLSRIAENNFGMVNGDMLGASNELSRAILLLLILVVI